MHLKNKNLLGNALSKIFTGIVFFFVCILFFLSITGIRLPKQDIYVNDGVHQKKNVFVTFTKNKEKQWLDASTGLMGAQFDGYFVNKFSSVFLKDWTIEITVPSPARLDPGAWEGIFSIDGSKLIIKQPYPGNEAVLGIPPIKNSHYDIVPNSQRKFGCIMYTLPDYEPDKAFIHLSYTPYFYISKMKYYAAAMIILFTMLVISCTYFIVSFFRKKEVNRQRIFITELLSLYTREIEEKDEDTHGHSERVSIYAKEIARRMNFSEKKQYTIYCEAMLHDIGKIYLPENILKKKGKLTEEERNIIKTHSERGAKILQHLTALPDAETVVLHHHESFDGTGYPDRLSEAFIPLNSRIICIADCFDAMASDRCYRSKISIEKIRQELIDNSGIQFDPDIVPYMISMIDDGFAPVKSL